MPLVSWMVVPTVMTRLLRGDWAAAGTPDHTQSARHRSPNPGKAVAPPSARLTDFGLWTLDFGLVLASVIWRSALLVINVVINAARVDDARDRDAFAAGDTEGARTNGTADLRGTPKVQLEPGRRMRQVAEHGKG